ncbi:MAG: hypothetical protein L0Z62_30270 [Gemmataceae bacterium]|nr:hypothetical protein [Gemmataceae bacterium]
MPMLLHDLAEETAASNQRASDRLDAEAWELDKLRRAASALQELRQQVVEAARQATDYVLARMPGVEGIWRWALLELRKKLTGNTADRLLRVLTSLFDSGQRRVRSPRALWRIAEQFGVTSERLDELDRVEVRCRELAGEANRALKQRARPWQPVDPERLALGLQLAREGKTVKADEARARFRITQE